MKRNHSMPVAVTSPQHVLENFLKENKFESDLAGTSLSLTPLADLDGIDVNDEIWIVQCPKGIDPCNLEEQKIKLPGKSTCNLIETFSEKFLKPKTVCLGYKSKDEFKVKQFPIQGSVLIRNHLKKIKTEEVDADCTSSSTRVPFPNNLKIRHPLHGVEFESKINLDKDIRDRLKKSDEILERRKSIKNTVKMEISSDSVKKNKNKTKEKKVTDDVSQDLAWITNL